MVDATRPEALAAGTADALRTLLSRIDGGSWNGYRGLRGRWSVGGFLLVVDRVPPDPFAGPARVRIVASRRDAGLDPDVARDRVRRVGVEDWLARRAVEAIARLGGTRPDAGRIGIQEIGQAVVERSACRVGEGAVELRLLVELPARGRRVRGRQAERLLLTDLPRLGSAVLVFSRRANDEAQAAADLAEDHAALRSALAARGLVAFLADGSLLARGGGGEDPDADRPRRDGRELPLEAPPSMRVELDVPHAGRIAGLGIPAGVTLVVGGGFHGKSTLLDAVARGVHPHAVGDGRERVATVDGAVRVRAEDGRSVRGVDISGFLGDLPSGERTRSFTTDRASGSTSQAASIVEALELGARLLLLDEDRSATNFLVRDGRMQRLVPRPGEPIIPYLDRVRELYDRFGVSTVLVTGGSGDYLEAADTVIRMEGFRPRDVTAEARDIAARTRTMRIREPAAPFPTPPMRALRVPAGLAAEKYGPRGPRAVRAGAETIDLAAVEPIVEAGQVRAVARCLRRLASRAAPGRTLEALVGELERLLDAEGLDALDPPVSHDLSRPRSFEIAAAVNRWRAVAFVAASAETEVEP